MRMHPASKPTIRYGADHAAMIQLMRTIESIFLAYALQLLHYPWLRKYTGNGFAQHLQVHDRKTMRTVVTFYEHDA